MSNPAKPLDATMSLESTTQWLDMVARDPVPWLLDPENPSVRYQTLRHIFQQPVSQLEKEQERVLAWQPIASLLRHWDHINFWGRADNPFYGGPVGNFGTLHLLAQLGAPRTEKIAAACENLLNRGQRPDGRFTPEGAAAAPWLSYTGMALQILMHFGYDEDPRTLAAWEALTATVQRDPEHLECAIDGRLPVHFTGPVDSEGRDDRVCLAGAAKVLGALIHRDIEPLGHVAEETVDRLCRYLLNHEYDWEDEDADWMLPRFPRHYDTDVIELAHVLSHTSYRAHPATARIVRQMLSLQDDGGRWPKRKTTPAFVGESVDQPSRWLTFEAVHALMAIYGDTLYAS